MIQIDDLSMSFGERTLFEAVSLNLNDSCRYGITGANGSGKSTLLGILSGETQDYGGAVRFPGSMKVGFLRQDHFDYDTERIIDVALMGRARLWAALKEKADLLEADLHDAETGMRLGELEGIISEEHGYVAESEAAIILEGLGIETARHYEPMGSLSGGYKLRVLLARCLFSAPGLLLLDEPTNHLDIVSISWLEGYLTNYSGIVVVVSHDHHFLNAVVTHILDIDYEAVRLYHGNYDFSLEAKGLNSLQQEQLIARQEKKKQELSAFYNRFRAQATKARQAMSRKKQLDKMDDIVIKRSSRIAPRFRFNQKRPSGKQVLEVKGLTKGFQGGSAPVISDLSVNVMRGERVAIIGPNGAGKTTLMKLIAGELTPDSGEVKYGHEVHPGYFAQNHREQIESGITVYDWLMNHSCGELTAVIRSILGAMLFSGDDAKKKSDALSGGEAARLVFSRLMLANDNLLLLDEPTNHLDIESIEALAGTLKDFPGTVVFVSHDRFFVEEVASCILEITPGAYEFYKGGYGDFLAAREMEREGQRQGESQGLLEERGDPFPDGGLKKKARPNKRDKGGSQRNDSQGAVQDTRALNKELSRAEAKSAKIEEAVRIDEERVEEINSTLATGELYIGGREEELAIILTELEKTQKRLSVAMEKWEKMHVRIDGIKGTLGVA